jgi:hypothetical protein
VITKHINNIFKEGELEEKSNVQKMHIANSDNLVQYSTNASAVNINYGEDIIINLGSVHNKDVASFLFTEYSDGISTGNTYQLNNLQIGPTNQISLLEIYKNSLTANGNINPYNYFLTNSTKWNN